MATRARRFSSRTASSAQHATASSSAPSLAFPKSKYPTPFEIFHFDTSQALTPSQVKGRYYDLCRLYHPDTKQSTSSDTSLEFKQIVAAYEVLRSPSKRSIYLRSGYGWTSNSPRPPGARTNDGYDFSRGPSMRYGGPGAGRGAYPSQAYDSAYWTDPYNPHFRPDASGGGPGTDMGGQATPGWGNKGFLGTNGTVFLALLSLTLIITPLSFYNLVPPSALLPADSPYSDPSWGGLSNGRDKRHDAAARALTEARQAAKDGGMAKREAMGRQVRLIEAERAYTRALEVERIERQEMGTGHLSLPLPPVETGPTPVNAKYRRL